MQYKPIIIFAFLVIISLTNCRRGTESHEQVAQKIINANISLLDSCEQLLVVYNEMDNDSLAILVALEKKGKGWHPVFGAVAAGIGKNGFAAPGKKVEGDGKSPTGLFRMGHLFTYEKEVDTRMPFTQATSDDKWIDDPESSYYNRHIRGKTDAKSYENLLLESDAYKYCMVIEYNTNPVVKGKGSAIFFHLTGEIPGSTAGCVAVYETDMKRILKWLDPKHHPTILMGNKEVLLAGLNK